MRGEEREKRREREKRGMNTCIGENQGGIFPRPVYFVGCNIFYKFFFLLQPFVAVERTTKKSRTNSEENHYAKGYTHLTKILKVGSPTKIDLMFTSTPVLPVAL